MNNKIHVEGINKGKIFIYTLSTCIWCRKAKEFLNTNGIEYDYIEMDAEELENRDIHKEELKNWNPKCSYPTIVINDSDCIVGFDEDKLKKVLGI